MKLYKKCISKPYVFLVNGTTLQSDENMRKITTVQGDSYKNGCCPDYDYFKNNCKLIAIDVTKQKALDADLKAIQQINFTANPDR